MGIEPTSLAWKARALPLSYARLKYLPQFTIRLDHWLHDLRLDKKQTTS